MNKEKSINRGLMTEGVIWKEILLFSIPLLLGNLFQQLYNAVDSVVVGNYIGAQALAAVGPVRLSSIYLSAFSWDLRLGPASSSPAISGQEKKKSCTSPCIPRWH